MMDIVITTHELHRIEAATPTTTAAQKVRFSFHIGYDVFLSVLAEVTEETDADGCIGHDVTILECVEEHGGFEIFPYQPGVKGLRAELEKKAVECSHNAKYHTK